MDELRDLVVSFVRRITIHQNHIEILLSRSDLDRVLEEGEKFIPKTVDRPAEELRPDDLICLTIEAKLKRFGGEVHLVIPPNTSGPPTRQPNPSLMKAVARARGWYERVLEGKASDRKSLNQHAGMDESYVKKVFSCAFLAPDIVEAIIDGRQPRDLTFKKLCYSSIAWNWEEQRKQFWFLSRAPHTLNSLFIPVTGKRISLLYP